MVLRYDLTTNNKSHSLFQICDMIKGNELNSILQLLSEKPKILHFDAKPIEIGYLVNELRDQFIKAENNIKQKNLNYFFANVSKNISPTSHSLSLIMSHIKKIYFC